MNDTQIGEIWVFFKDYLRKEDISAAAESFVDLLADFGIKDKVLELHCNFYFAFKDKTNNKRFAI
jgi:hypothetical protein